MPARPVPRRTALTVTAALTGLVAAGCTSDPVDPAGPSGAPSAPSATVAPPDADQVLVDEVVARLTTALSGVVAARQGSPRLRRELGSLERLHLAHLDALGIDESAVTYAPLRALPRSELLAAEGRLQRFLATAAVRAESGSLARLLASMSAAVAQHLAVLR